jgi:hypothetical protein
MKNQYVGDIGDFAKYYLLRQLAKSELKIGVNWYLTKDDPNKEDGKHVGYLFSKNSTERKDRDPDLCNVLRRLLYEDKRSVVELEKSKILPIYQFYNDVLDKSNNRKEWFDKCMKSMRDVDVLFFDPDNGLASDDNSIQHASYDEICEAYHYDKYYEGKKKSVVIYQHGGIRKEGWFDKRITELISSVGNVDAISVYWNNKVQQRFFIILWQKEHKEKVVGTEIEKSILKYLEKYPLPTS